MIEGERPDRCQIVLCPCGGRSEAEDIAVHLVESRLAAAVNIVAADSVYRWQGRVEREVEFLLVIKSRLRDYDEIERNILEMHSYRLPGILAIPVAVGFGPYLDWMNRKGAP